MADKGGRFKETFEDEGIKVELVQGILSNETQLTARGDLHFTDRMLYPYLPYRSWDADLTAVQVSNHSELRIASTIVPKDSPIKTPDDLEGRKITSWRAGCLYMTPYELAGDRGWKEGTGWAHVNIPSSESEAAPISRQVDATSAYPLTDMAATLLDGSGREIANPAEDSVYINGGSIAVTFISSESAERRPNISKTYPVLQDKTEQQTLQNLDEASTIVEGVSRIPANISKFAWDRIGATWSPNTDPKETESETKTMQGWLAVHGDIASDKRVGVPKLFASQYFDQ